MVGNPEIEGSWRRPDLNLRLARDPDQKLDYDTYFHTSSPIPADQGGTTRSESVLDLKDLRILTTSTVAHVRLPQGGAHEFHQ